MFAISFTAATRGVMLRPNNAESVLLARLTCISLYLLPVDAQLLAGRFQSSLVDQSSYFVRFAWCLRGFANRSDSVFFSTSFTWLRLRAGSLYRAIDLVWFRISSAGSDEYPGQGPSGAPHEDPEIRISSGTKWKIKTHCANSFEKIILDKRYKN